MVTVGFSGGGSGSSGIAVQIAAAGSGSGNDITNTVLAEVGDAGTVNVHGAMNVQASDTSTIVAIAGAVAAGGAVGSSVAVSGAIGISAAVNSIKNNVSAAVSGNTVAAVTGAANVTATESAAVWALTLGGAVGIGASTGGVGVGVGAAGAGSGNTIRNTVTASVRNGRSLTNAIAAGGNVNVSATDASSITANAGGVGIAVGVGGTGVGVSLGVAFSDNDVSNQVTAAIAFTGVTAGGAVNVAAGETATIKALSIGGAVAVGAGGSVGVAASVAGAGSFNTIKNAVQATIGGPNWTVRANGGDVSVSAFDRSAITANAGGVGVAVGVGSATGVGIAIGFAAAQNDIQDTVQTWIDGTGVVASANVKLLSGEGATIDALTIGGAVGAGLSGNAGVGVGGAGAGSGNKINNTLLAAVRNGANATATTGGVSVKAEDVSVITANAGGVGVAVGGGQIGVGASLGVGFAENKISNTVQALVNQGTATGATGVTLTATEYSIIKALSIGGAAAIGLGLDAGIAIAGAGAGSFNTIRNVVTAAAQNGALLRVTGNGDARLNATDTSTINATAGGVAAGVGVGGVGGAVTVGASSLDNDVANRVSALADESRIQTANGALTLNATERATASGLAIGGAGSGGGGPFGSFAVAGSGAEADNSFANTVQAHAANSTLIAGGNGGISLAATDNSTGDAQAVAGSLALGFAGPSGSVAIGIAVARNAFANTVLAFTDGSTLNAGGGITLNALETSGGSALTVAASVSVAIGAGVAFSGGGAASTNTADNAVAAYARDGSLTAAGDVNILADGTASLDAKVGAVAVAGAAVSASISVSVGSNTDTSKIQAYVDGSSVASTGGSVTVAASTGGSLDAFSVATSVALSAGLAGASASSTDAAGGVGHHLRGQPDGGPGREPRRRRLADRHRQHRRHRDRRPGHWRQRRPGRAAGRRHRQRQRADARRPQRPRPRPLAGRGQWHVQGTGRRHPGGLRLASDRDQQPPGLRQKLQHPVRHRRRDGGGHRPADQQRDGQGGDGLQRHHRGHFAGAVHQRRPSSPRCPAARPRPGQRQRAGPGGQPVQHRHRHRLRRCGPVGHQRCPGRRHLGAGGPRPRRRRGDSQQRPGLQPVGRLHGRHQRDRQRPVRRPVGRQQPPRQRLGRQRRPGRRGGGELRAGRDDRPGRHAGEHQRRGRPRHHGPVLARPPKARRGRRGRRPGRHRADQGDHGGQCPDAGDHRLPGPVQCRPTT